MHQSLGIKDTAGCHATTHYVSSHPHIDVTSMGHMPGKGTKELSCSSEYIKTVWQLTGDSSRLGEGSGARGTDGTS